MSWAGEHRFIVVAMAYSVAVIAADLLLGHDDSILSLLIVIPFLIAAEWQWRATAATAVAPLILVATSMLGRDAVPGRVVVLRVAGFLVGSSFAVYLSAERVRRERTLTDSRAAAAAAQRAIIPPVPARSGRYGFTSLYRSAAEESLIGGDFFKVIPSPGGTRLILGDVEGKGLGAVSMSALVLGCFREWAPRTASLEDLVAVLDERVHHYEERSAFVTAVVASLRDDLTLEVANCGHTHPILVRQGRTTEIAPERSTLPLGLGPKPTITRLALRPGDRLLFYTDGLVETRDSRGGWVELDSVIGGLSSEHAARALDGVVSRLTEQGVLRDDLAMLLVEADRDVEPGGPLGSP